MFIWHNNTDAYHNVLEPKVNVIKWHNICNLKSSLNGGIIEQQPVILRVLKGKLKKSY